MAMNTRVSPRVVRVLHLILRLAPEERRQLGAMLPPEMTLATTEVDATVREAVAWVREQAAAWPRPPSLDDPFIGGLTYREYFALSDEEADALWERLADEMPDSDNAPIVEVSPNARIPAL